MDSCTFLSPFLLVCSPSYQLLLLLLSQWTPNDTALSSTLRPLLCHKIPFISPSFRHWFPPFSLQCCMVCRQQDLSFVDPFIFPFFSLVAYLVTHGLDINIKSNLA